MQKGEEARFHRSRRHCPRRVENVANTRGRREERVDGRKVMEPFRSQFLDSVSRLVWALAELSQRSSLLCSVIRSWTSSCDLLNLRETESRRRRSGLIRCAFVTIVQPRNRRRGGTRRPCLRTVGLLHRSGRGKKQRSRVLPGIEGWIRVRSGRLWTSEESLGRVFVRIVRLAGDANLGIT